MENLSIERAMPDVLHLKINETRGGLSFGGGSHHAMFWPDLTPRTLEELLHYDGLTPDQRITLGGFDFESLLLSHADIKELPPCGINGVLVRFRSVHAQ